MFGQEPSSQVIGEKVVAEVEIYDVVIATDRNLSSGRPVAGRVPHLTVDFGHPVPQSPLLPPGELMLDGIADGTRLYAMVRTESGYLLRIVGVGDCHLDLSAKTMHCVLHPETDPALFDIFLGGMIPALLLYLRGEFVMHAAAVARGNRTVAIAGQSGRGKSTLATLLCCAGALLISDDVLCAHTEDGRASWRGSCTELRLRPAAAPIVDDFFPDVPSRATADGRIAISPPVVSASGGRLDLVAVPTPSRDGSDLIIELMPPIEAFTTLIAFPRLIGWRDPSVQRRQFEGLASLVSAVPVVRVQMPWGPPFERSLIDRLWPEITSVLGAQ